MVEPEKAEAALRDLMQKESPLVGTLLLDMQQQMVISSLLPPEVDVLKFAGLAYRSFTVREQLFELLDSPAEHTLLWGEKYVIVIRAAIKQPLLMVGILSLPNQLGAVMIEMQQTLNDLDRA